MQKKFRQYVIPPLITVVLVTIGFVCIHGFPLIGIPDVDEVSYIEVTDAQLSAESRKFEESNDIQAAVNMVHSLNYEWGTPESTKPLITIDLYLNDGEVVTVGANEEAVFWNGKQYNIKKDNGKIFIKVMEGMFFFDIISNQ